MTGDPFGVVPHRDEPEKSDPPASQPASDSDIDPSRRDVVLRGLAGLTSFALVAGVPALAAGRTPARLPRANCGDPVTGGGFQADTNCSSSQADADCGLQVSGSPIPAGQAYKDNDCGSVIAETTQTDHSCGRWVNTGQQSAETDLDCGKLVNPPNDPGGTSPRYTDSDCGQLKGFGSGGSRVPHNDNDCTGTPPPRHSGSDDNNCSSPNGDPDVEGADNACTTPASDFSGMDGTY